MIAKLKPITIDILIKAGDEMKREKIKLGTKVRNIIDTM